MNLDFHYYGTYSAARLAGYDGNDAKVIAYYAQFVDECSKDFLIKNNIEDGTPTVQSDEELRALFKSLKPYTENEMTEAAEIWGAFHFLPGNVNDEISPGGMSHSQKLIFKRLCMHDSILAVQTVKNAKANGTLPAIGMAMHILADTWAHCYFVGIPEKFINDASGEVWEADKNNKKTEKFMFTWDTFEDNLPKNHYSCTPPNPLRDQSITYLGHARMGHLPDYGFMKYSYRPAWKNGAELTKDNPADFMKAFCQMIAALQYIKGDKENFNPEDFAKLGRDTECRIQSIINTKKADTCVEWKEFIENYLFSEDEGGLEDFDKDKCVNEYLSAGNINQTDLFKFLEAAKAHKQFVTAVVGKYPVN